MPRGFAIWQQLGDSQTLAGGSIPKALMSLLQNGVLWEGRGHGSWLPLVLLSAALCCTFALHPNQLRRCTASFPSKIFARIVFGCACTCQLRPSQKDSRCLQASIGWHATPWRSSRIPHNAQEFGKAHVCELPNRRLRRFHMIMGQNNVDGECWSDMLRSFRATWSFPSEMPFDKG